MDMKLEVVVLPVSDVDRSKRFYEMLGWRLDADIAVRAGVRVVQFTPPGSACSIHIGSGITPVAPGSVRGLFLVVDDIEAARAELCARGVDVGEVYHNAGDAGRVAGLESERRSYASYAAFSDPDGNDWLLQEVRVRLPGR